MGDNDLRRRSAGDPELRARLVAAPDGEVDWVRAFRFDIRLRGEQETPFFED